MPEPDTPPGDEPSARDAVSGDEPEQSVPTSRTPRWWTTGRALAVIAVLVASGVLFALRPLRGAGGGNGADDVTDHTLPALPSSPVKLGAYTTKFAGYDSVQVAGSRQHPYVVMNPNDASAAKARIVSLDSRGAEQWSLTYEGSIRVEARDGQLLVFETVRDHSTLHSLDETTGRERWAVATSATDYWVFKRRVYLATETNLVELYDLDSGARIAARDFDVLGDVKAELLSHSLFVGVVAGRLQVFDTELEEVNDPIPVEKADTVSYQDGRLVAASGGQLTLFDESGNVEGRANVGSLWSIVGIGDGSWFFVDERGCGTFDFSDRGFKLRWRRATVACSAPNSTDVNIDLVVVAGRNLKVQELLHARSGRVVGRAERFQPAANGYLSVADGRFDAFSLPRKHLLFSGRLPDDDATVNLIDGGFIVSDPPTQNGGEAPSRPTQALTIILYGS